MININFILNLQIGEYEPENGDHYRGNSPQAHGGGPSRYGPPKQLGPSYNRGEMKPYSNIQPLSNYQTNRPRKPSNYGPEIYSSNGGNAEYSNGNGPSIEELSMAPEHSGYPSEIEHNHLHSLPGYNKHKMINDVYEPVDHLPPPYIPSDFPSLSGGPSLGGISGMSSYANPMDLIYSSPYKFGGPPHYGGKPSGGYRPSLLGSASNQNSQSAGSSSNYGQFLSSLLSAYSLGSLKPSSGKPSTGGSKGGLASYLNLPGFDLLKVSYYQI